MKPFKKYKPKKKETWNNVKKVLEHNKQLKNQLIQQQKSVKTQIEQTNQNKAKQEKEQIPS